MINKKICIVYSHHKLGDLIWQLPYIKSISDHHLCKITLKLDLKHKQKIYLKMKFISRKFITTYLGRKYFIF